MDRHVNTSQTIGTSPAVVSIEKDNANGKRHSIIIINTSTLAQVITLAIDAEAQALAGIVLYPGGSWQDSRDSGYYPTQKQITAVSSAAGGTIAIQERVGD